jgi:hypothetical protein
MGPEWELRSSGGGEVAANSANAGRAGRAGRRGRQMGSSVGLRPTWRADACGEGLSRAQASGRSAGAGVDEGARGGRQAAGVSDSQDSEQRTGRQWR